MNRALCGPLTALALLPLCWSITCLMFFSKNGATYLLISGIAGAAIGVLLILADLCILFWMLHRSR